MQIESLIAVHVLLDSLLTPPNAAQAIPKVKGTPKTNPNPLDTTENSPLKEPWAMRMRMLFGKGRKQRALQDICKALLSEKGQALGNVLAYTALEAFHALDEKGRLDFYLSLTRPPFAPDTKEILAAATRYAQDATPIHRSQLVGLVDGPRQRLFRRMHFAQGATLSMLQMRSEMLDLSKKHPTLRNVEMDLWRLFSSWFNRGFLRLMRLNWDTRAAVLEKLISYEAVHEMKGWEDLKARMAEEDRRCFGFFHRNLQGEPLIFVEVALTKEIPSNIASLIDPNRPSLPGKQAHCAVFYSISNCQKGLQGVSFGNLLIKQVSSELRKEFPQLKTFVTLSPVPGFVAWLQSQACNTSQPLMPQLQAVLTHLNTPNWHTNPAVCKALQPPLCALGAWYLLCARRRNSLVDPVARFHVANGASVERINWLGDLSPKGLRQAGGLMVNYLYRMDEVEKNHEAFINHLKVPASRGVKNLANKALVVPPSGS